MLELKEIVDWASNGHRYVKIEIDTLHGKTQPRVWCYDYDNAVGTGVDPDGPIPDLRTMLEEQADSLNRQLKALYVKRGAL